MAGKGLIQASRFHLSFTEVEHQWKISLLQLRAHKNEARVFKPFLWCSCTTHSFEHCMLLALRLVVVLWRLIAMTTRGLLSSCVATNEPNKGPTCKPTPAWITFSIVLYWKWYMHHVGSGDETSSTEDPQIETVGPWGVITHCLLHKLKVQ